MEKSDSNLKESEHSFVDPRIESQKSVVIVADVQAGCLGKCLPPGIKQEIKGIVSLSASLIVISMFTTYTGVISSIFAGHLGKIELDGIGLAITIINVFGMSLAMGMGSACDTLFSQSYGSPNKKLVGVYLQRSIILYLLVCLLCLAIYMNSASLLIALYQPPEVAIVTEEYLWYFSPGLVVFNGSLLWNFITELITQHETRPLHSWFHTFGAHQCGFMWMLMCKYLNCQNSMKPTVLVCVGACAVDAALQYPLVYVLDLRVKGAAICHAIAYFIMLITVLVYIFWSKAYTLTWEGWTWKCLEDWGQFGKLALSGTFLICVEWWSTEIGLFLVGALGVIELGATTVLLQIEGLLFAIALGVSLSGTIRIGQYLGKGNKRASAVAAKSLCLLASVVALFIGLFLVAFKDILAYVFTSDPDVLQLAAQLMPLCGLWAAADGAKVVCSGVLRGCGRQFTGAVISLTFFGLMGFPIAIPLIYYTPLRAAGFWWGMAIAGIVGTVAFITTIVRMDWEKELGKARERTEMEETIQRSMVFQNEYSPLIGHKPHSKRLSSADKARIMLKRMPVIIVIVFIFIASLVIRTQIDPRLPYDHGSSNSTSNTTDGTTVPFYD